MADRLANLVVDFNQVQKRPNLNLKTGDLARSQYVRSSSSLITIAVFDLVLDGGLLVLVVVVAADDQKSRGLKSFRG